MLMLIKLALIFSMGLVQPGQVWGTIGTKIPAQNRPWISLAISHCPHHGRGRKVDPQMLKQLLDAEVAVGVPRRFRGMSLAKACIETGFQADKEGDCWRADGSCYAKGIIQLWPWADKYVDRLDPVASVQFFLERIKLGAKTKVLKFCPGVKGSDARWKVAWLRVNRGPHRRNKGGKRVARCGGVPPHGLTQLRKWQKLRAWKIGASYEAISVLQRTTL